MKHLKSILAIAMLLCSWQTSFATMISTAATPTSMWKGATMPCPQCESGVACDNSQMSNMCAYAMAAPVAGSVGIAFEDVTGVYGTLRIIFNQSWGSGVAIAGTAIPLPPFVATYYGVASLRIMTGTYVIAPATASYPFGYIDVVTGP